LKLATPTPWGGSGFVTVADGAVLDLNGQNVTATNGLKLNGTGILGGGALINSSPTGAGYAGLINLPTASSIVGGTGNINLSNPGIITGSNLTLGGAQGGTLSSILGTGVGTLTKVDAGTWTLGGLNTFTGNATLSAGTLKLGSTTPWGGSGTVSVSNGAALDLNGQSVVVGSARGLTLNGTGISGSGALFNSSSLAANYGGTLTLGSASSIVGSRGTISLSGGISGTGLKLGGR
jgi:autotransporter-associated beta strand protein